MIYNMLMSDCFSNWLPGVLSKEQAQTLWREGYIDGTLSEGNFDNSSIDLTLDSEGYRMPFGSIKPFGEGYNRVVHREKDFFVPIPTASEYQLEPNTTYLFRLEQHLARKMSDYPIYGQATAKSSIGRVDVLARLIVDGMDCYESFTQKGISLANGHMFVEITPLTFPVKIKKGTAITQLRLFYGNPDDCEIKGREVYNSTLLDGDSDGYLSVDLSEAVVELGEIGCAFSAKRKGNDIAIPLWKTDPPPCPRAHWELLHPTQFNGRACLGIQKEKFYILRSKEKMALQAGVAVYCMAIDETIGEMRIHYAGFVHPFFGRDRSDDTIGTPLIFEVRGHDVQVVLTDGEKLAKLKFYRMSEDCKRPSEPGPYGNQTLQLSKLFAPWGKPK